MDKFGARPEQWFHRRVPIWVTEYGEQTTPEYPTGGVSYAQQAAHAKLALQLAAAEPVRRDVHLVHPPRQHREDLVQRPRDEAGAKKPAYAVFASDGAGSSARRRSSSPARRSRSRLAVPFLPTTTRRAPGRRHLPRLRRQEGGRRRSAARDDRAPTSTVTFTVKFTPGEGQDVHDDRRSSNDKHGQHAATTRAVAAHA